MNTPYTLRPLPSPERLRLDTGRGHDAAPDAHHANIRSYYSEATQDYEAWSLGYNMHFGFCDFSASSWRREVMLEGMNLEVLGRLDLARHEAPVVVDLGCGMGATLRCGARVHEHATFIGVTLVDWQAQRAQRMNAKEPGAERLSVRTEDYTRTGIPDATAHGVYAIESACHAAGSDKADVVAEAARLLKPGGRFVVADAFRIRPHARLFFWQRWAYRALCDFWALECFATVEHFTEALEAHGFEDVVIEDISAHVAPSVMWVPWVSWTFLWQAWRNGERLSTWRRRNVWASLLSIVLGLSLGKFRYLVVHATRSA